MTQKDKTKEELIEEIKFLQKWIAEIKTIDNERKRAEEELREGIRSLAQAQQLAQLGNWKFIPATGKTVWSEEMFRVYGLEPANEAPPFEVLAQMVYEEDRQRWGEAIKEGRRTGRFYNLEYRIIWPDGQYRWLLAHESMQPESKETPLVFYGTVLDITERKQAEEELRDSENKYRFLFDVVPISMSITNLDGRAFMVNSGFEELTGYTKEEFIAFKDVSEMYVDRAQRKQLVALLQKEGKARDFETKLKRKDGTAYDALMNVDFIKLGSEQVLLTTVRDITERKRAEEELQKEKQFTENIINTAQVVMLVLEKEGRIVTFNPYMEQISGYRLEEVKGKDWFETFIPKEDHAKVRELFSKAISGIQTKGNVNSVITKDGRKIEIEWYDKTIKDADGSIEGLLSIGQDITERKKAEKMLLVSERRFKILFEQSKDAIFIADSQTRMLIDCNLQAEKLIGRSKEEILSMRADDLHPKDAVDEIMDIFKRQAVGKDIMAESFVLAKDGQRIPVSINTVLVEIEGKPHLVGTFRDITERKKTEEETRKRLQELEVFYKASVGREERIIELKKEVERLKKELGK